MYDVTIIGAGPAGITAGLYTKRANLKTIIFYQENSTLDKTDKIDNYYGFSKGITGKKLYEEGIKQAKNLDIELKKEEVIGIAIGEDGFRIKTTKKEYSSKIVILATGNKKKRPNIEGVKELEGKGISYCAICDGFFYRNRSVSVLGSGNYAISEANELINIANKITILTNGEKAPEFRSDNVDIQTKEIKKIKGEKRVEQIEFIDGTKLETHGVFIAQGVAGSSDFAKKLGIITKNENIIVNDNMETNIKGIYACGDCTGGLLQISKAVYEGTKAGLQAVEYVRKNK